MLIFALIMLPRHHSMGADHRNAGCTNLCNPDCQVDPCMTAIFGVLAVLTWHLYFTVFKERNSSIFTGMMSEQEMKKITRSNTSASSLLAKKYKS